MNKENLLQEMKAEMIKIVKRINYNNFYESQEDLGKYFNVMGLIGELPSSDEEYLEDDFEEDELEVDNQYLENLEEVNDELNGKYEGKAKLKLGGADLGSFKIFIPEKLVRLLDIEEGDWVRAIEMENRMVNGHAKPIYDYRIIKKSDSNEESNREVIKFSTVEYDAVLKEHYILSSEIDNAPTKILLNEQRLGNLTVNQGDIVDYAYWKEDILSGRIIWKHNMNFELAKSKMNLLDQSQVELPEDFLQESTIGFIGQAEKENEYISCVESYGGQVRLLEALSNFYSIETKLEEVDLAIAFVDNLSASELKKVYDAAENIQVAMVYAKEMDCSSLMHWIRDELELHDYEWR